MSLPSARVNVPCKIRWLNRRRILKWLGGVAALLIAGYSIENYRGRNALEAIQERYATERISLDPNDYLHPAPPPDTNFCATPLLEGMVRADEASGGPKTLGFQLPALVRTRKDIAPASPPGQSARPVSPEWAAVRASMSREKTYSGRPHTRPKGSLPWAPAWPFPENAESDAHAVYAALNRERAIFEELQSAVRRTVAVFTPVPRSWKPSDFSRQISDFRGLASLLSLRIAAAAETGQHSEAAALASVFWRLREAYAAEPCGSGAFQSRMWLGRWRSEAKEILRARPSDQALQMLMEFPLRWEPEREFLDITISQAAQMASHWNYVVNEARWTWTGGLEGQFRERGWLRIRTALTIPSGWLMQSEVLALQIHLDHYILPALRGGPGALVRGQEAFIRQRDAISWFNPYAMLAQVKGDGGTYPTSYPTYIFHGIQNTRLLLLALAMERCRLATGRYPAGLNDLAPAFIPAIPPDLDGKPLRARINEQGSAALLYSTGWNLKDDWQGTPPDGAVTDDSSDLDWTLQLPIPQ